ncbi:hypothetical protein EDD68_10910 [Melghiribacillus thermohalophilus]|uniref:YdbS-like PH domain-containing protein n=1 Tax=Melghiribacillus thermohalophilus TaxID=1324956 RepID=A0A4R3N0Y2_9BACI|nr:PH domain-containing protein [Melghiribacillus thermohalophilus]TCT22364.1 hypothetical protein EDD68_10910 [Melghiribacillus thermohalophilus]
MDEKDLKHTISPHFIKVRLISEMITNIIGFIVLLILYWLDGYFQWPDWVGWILHILLILTILGTIWDLFEPKYLYRSWRYGLDPEYLYLSYGVIKKEWVTIPVTKIQSVSSTQGPLMKMYKLRSIKVETMGSSQTIPGLDEPTAFKLKEEIAEYAKLKEEES